MIDTLVKKLEKFKVEDGSKFKPSNVKEFMEHPWRYVEDGKPYKAFVIYQRDKMNLAYLYLYFNYYMEKPALYIRINSIAKLLYGNNVQEVKQSDFKLIISKIKELLLECGIECSEQDLKEAVVREVHYSINFNLPENITAQGAMDVLATSTIPGFHLDKNLYLNTGGVKFRTIDRRRDKEKKRKPPIEISFYDKCQEMKDRQPDIILPNSANILRYEVKLYKLSNIKRFPIGEIFYTSENRQFRNVFNEHYSRLILKGFLNELKKNMPKSIYIDCPLSDKISVIQELKQEKGKYKLQNRQMLDTLMKLYLTSKNQTCKFKILGMLLCSFFFFNDKKCIKILKKEGLDEKEFREILIFKKTYENILDILIQMLGKEDE